MTTIYLSDLKEDKQTDIFMGKGTEALKREAEKKDCEVIIGEFNKKPYLEE